MNPEEKAKSLVERFENEIGHSALNVISDAHNLDEETRELAKQCALLCIKEMKHTLQNQIKEADHLDIIYLNKVEKEIEKL